MAQRQSPSASPDPKQTTGLRQQRHRASPGAREALSIDDLAAATGTGRGQGPRWARWQGLRRTRTRWWRTVTLRVLAGAGVVVAVLAALAVRSSPSELGAQPPPRDQTGGAPVAPAGPTVQLRLGVTHPQHSADPWNERGAVANAERYLSAQKMLQNQHIMGFGVLNPEPSPDAYDFASLDRRMELIRRTGGTPVITLCCAPDWMKGGQTGETDWSLIEEAPEPEHFGDFAELSAEVARRYPWVRHYLVWNELKGFWNSEEHRWDYEGYTELYNQVYTALKQVDPEIQVGGPYAVTNGYAEAGGNVRPSSLRGPWGTVDQRDLDAITYWLEHNRGADFLVLDSATATSDQGLTTDPFTATSKFAVVARWARERTDLPLWWAEWYVDDDEASEGWSPEQWTAVRTAALIHMTTSGSSAALLWEPEGNPDNCRGCLWSSTRRRGGGTTQPFGQVYANFQRFFPAGTRLDRASVSDPKVLSLASADHAVLVNTTADRHDVTFDDRPLTLEPHEVRWVTR